MGLIANLLGAQLIDSAQVTAGKLAETRRFEGNVGLFQAYGHWQHRAGERLILNLGVYGQTLSLNQSFSIEPRLNMRYNLTAGQALTLGLGRHSQIQSLGVYFNQPAGQSVQSNRELDFTYSNQAVLGYELRFADFWRVQLEGYFQDIRRAPVDAAPSSFSMLNMGADFGLTDRSNLKNKGTGQNYGLEFTLERTFDKGFYILGTASLYKSTYKGSDGVEHSTAFDGRYVANVLAGREFSLSKKMVLALDTRISAAGGKRDTPLDLAQSALQHRAVYLENLAYSIQLKDYFRTDFKITLRMNGRKVMQEWFVDFQNLFNNQNIFSRQYDAQRNIVRTVNQLGFYPNINYRIQF